jgi:hypothetical protein
MSAISNAQFHQLDMFRPASQLNAMRLGDVDIEHLNQNGLGKKKTLKKKVMKEKLKDATEWGLLDSVQEHGVRQPVTIQHDFVTNYAAGSNKKVNQQTLSDGHHRVAAAMAIDPKMLIPVKHETYD